MGALLALEVLPPLRVPARAEAVGLSGLVLLAGSIVFITRDLPFPGLLALPPCLGAAAVIYSGADGRTLTSRLLALPPLRFVGLISYSLYLIHWPVIVFYSMVRIPAFADKCALIVLCLLAATLMWRFVERPFRKGPHRLGRVGTLVASFSAMAVIAVAAVSLQPLIREIWHIPARAEVMLAYTKYDSAEMMREGTCFLTADHNDVDHFQKDTCLHIDPTRKNILIAGDSHAAHLFAGLSAQYPNVNFLLAAAGSCKPFLRPGRDRRCNDLMHLVFADFLPAARLDGVILSGRWGPADVDPLVTTAEGLAAQQPRVIVFGPIVEYDQALPRLLASALVSGDVASVERHRLTEQSSTDERLSAAFAATGITYVSVYRNVCPSACTTTIDGDIPIQFDYGHLTREGSVYLASQLPQNLF